MAVDHSLNVRECDQFIRQSFLEGSFYLAFVFTKFWRDVLHLKQRIDVGLITQLKWFSRRSSFGGLLDLQFEIFTVEVQTFAQRQLVHLINMTFRASLPKHRERKLIRLYHS